MSSTGDMERDVTLVPKKKKMGKSEKEEISNSPLTGETSNNKAAQMQRLPFAMPRKVADVFVVMEGEVPDCILKDEIRNELHLHTSNFNTHSGKKNYFQTLSRSDEVTQPWARQSLVQLAPIWGTITDPQTVQTTTSDQSEY